MFILFIFIHININKPFVNLFLRETPIFKEEEKQNFLI